MPLVVEDGSNVQGANSFVTREEIIAYAADRGVVLVNDATTDVLGVKACDWIVSQPCYKGKPAFETQSLPFPRTCDKIYEPAVDGVYPIPSGVKRCQLQLCLDVNSGVDIMPTIEASAGKSIVASEKLGPLATTYRDTTTSTQTTAPLMPIAQAAIRPFLCLTGGGLRSYRA